MEDSRTKASTICRLCLETLNTTTRVGIDLSTMAEVRAIVKEMYTIEVFATDQHRSICIPCYKSMITHYKNAVRHWNKKRIVQMNYALQLKLMAGGAQQENDAVPTKPTDDTNISNAGSRDRSASATNKQGSVTAPAAKETSNKTSSKTYRVASPTLPTEQNNNNTQKNSVTKSAARKVAIGTESVSSDKNRSSTQPAAAEEKKKSQKSSVDRNQSFLTPSKSSASSSGECASKSSRRNDRSSSDKKTGQKASEKASEKAPEKASEKASEEAPEKSSEQTAEKSSEKAPEKASGKQQDTVAGSSLVPVVLVKDCMTHPDYLNALYPLKISLNLDDVKPQEYLCGSCFLVFKAEDEYRTHLRRSCARACRYCYAKIEFQHQCAISSKYSNLYPSINAFGKYCSKEKENAGTHKENEISVHPRGSPSKPKPDDQNLTSSAITRKSRQDKSWKKGSKRARSNSGSSISSRPLSRQFVSSSDSSSESSVERSTVVVVSESDEEMQTFISTIKRNMKKKIKQANRILD